MPISHGGGTGVREWDGGHETLAAQLAATQERYRTLFETLPQGVVYYAADGRIIEANPAVSQILGVDAATMRTWPLVLTGGAVRADGTPFAPSEYPVMVALRTGTVVTDVVMGVQHGRSGELRWLRVTAVPDARDEQGRPQRAYAMFRDVTEHLRAEAALREGTELMAHLREANVLGVVGLGQQQVYEANDAFLDMIGYSQDDVAAGRISYQALSPPEWASSDAEAVQQMLRTGAFRSHEKEYLHRDGHRVPVLVGGAVVSRAPLRWVTFVVDLTARRRAEDERAELLARERAARAEADGARDRLTFLMRGGDLVAAARDRHELLQHSAKLVVDSLADFCLVFLPTEDGTLRATSIAHRDHDRIVRVADLRDQPDPIIGRRTVNAAFSTGTSRLVRDVAAHHARWSGLASPVGDIIVALRPEDVLFTPLVAGQQNLGVVAVGRSAGQPGFVETDIGVLEELARQMAAGLANADTFARDHTVAETLQRSVLPDALPDIAGLDLAVRYLPGTDGVHVGGDWYDAFALDGRRVGLAVGDVVGHNVASASIMGQVRNLLRAYAVENDEPCDVLERTNRALARLLPEAMATAVYAVLDLGTGDLSYASAGHPPLVCTSGDGQAEYLDEAIGTMLGAPGISGFPAGYRRLAPGSGLLFYTDGLIENRQRDITEGLSALASVMRQSAGQAAEQTCAAVQAALLGTAPRTDDVCLLAARLTA